MAHIPTAVFAVLTLGGLALAVVSYREGEARAARIGSVATVLLVAMTVAFASTPGLAVPGLLLVAAMIVAAVLMLRPTGRPAVPEARHDVRIDERTIMFSRKVLKPGDGRFETYYDLHPEHREPDDRFRAKPGLLSPRAVKAEPLSFAAADASFRAVEELAPLVRGEAAAERVERSPEVFTRFVKGWARKLGARDCGVANLRDDRFYTVKGRGERWGEAIERRHRWAVVVTVEMDHRQMASSPDGPTIMESAQQYLDSGRIAVQLAEACRRLGWEADAHIDANYDLICPPTARDAGLGEIGRMGLLMTPRLGPRVRLAVVTTDLPLIPDEPTDDPTVLDFCTVCQKCADVCPAGAIPHGPRADADGRLRWVIDQEACYTFWTAAGTDCGRCVAVCPYSHPDNALHGLVRWGLKRNALFRKVALKADDLLYGRRPAPRRVPSWLPERSGSAEDPS